MTRAPAVVLLLLTLASAAAAAAAPPATTPGADAVPPVAGPLAAVNVRQGTDSSMGYSHGNTLPLLGPPWAMLDWSVQNAGGIDERWFYAARNTRFAGFRATHQPSPWVGDYGQFMLSPQTGPVVLGVEDRACDYDPAAAVLRPDYDRVRLDRYHVTAELTGSERCGVLRLRFDPGQASGRIVFDMAGACQLQASGDEVSGYSRHHELAAAGDWHCYFVGRLDRPITKAVTVGTATAAGRGSGYVEFAAGGPPVQLRIATSYISPAQAWRTLDAETAGGFDAVRARTAAAWNEKLARITVDGGTDAQRDTFYTCLYRTMKFPHRLYEIDAAGQPTHYSPWDGHVHPGVAYTDSGLWDTFRTQFPLMSIAYPQQLGEIVAGWLNAYRESGGLPTWPSPGGVRGVMTGSHADALLADAMCKGIGGFDYRTAYAALHHDAFDRGTAGTTPARAWPTTSASGTCRFAPSGTGVDLARLRLRRLVLRPGGQAHGPHRRLPHAHAAGAELPQAVRRVGRLHAGQGRPRQLGAALRSVRLGRRVHRERPVAGQLGRPAGRGRAGRFARRTARAGRHARPPVPPAADVPPRRVRPGDPRDDRVRRRGHGPVRGQQPARLPPALPVRRRRPAVEHRVLDPPGLRDAVRRRPPTATPATRTTARPPPGTCSARWACTRSRRVSRRTC